MREQEVVKCQHICMILGLITAPCYAKTEALRHLFLAFREFEQLLSYLPLYNLDYFTQSGSFKSKKHFSTKVFFSFCQGHPDN